MTLKAVALHASYGGRTHSGVMPVALRISDCVMSIWEATPWAVSLERSGWFQVWFPTGNPAATTCAANCG